MKLSLDRRVGQLAALAVMVATATLAGPTAALGATDDSGWLRLGHFSPDTVAVDVRVTALSGGTVLLELQNVGYGDISAYEGLPQGTYAISMIAAGSGDWTKLAVSDQVTVGPATATTVAAYGPADDLQVRAFDDDLTAPAAGNARIRVVQASTITPTVDVQTTTGVVIAEDAPSGEATPYTDVPAGAWTLELSGAGVSDESEVEVAAGTITSLFVLDTADGGLTIVPILDSAGTPLVPYGGTDTGGGWLATHGAQQQHATGRLGAVAF